MRAINETGLRKELRALLEAQRGTLWARLRSLRDSPPAQGTPVKDAEEQGLDDLAVDIDVALVEMDAASLEATAEALARLEGGNYGTCADCGEAIPAARLRALAFALRCLRCQEVEEARGDPPGPPAESLSWA